MPTTPEYVPVKLNALADLFRERNKLYSSNYKEVGKIFVALFPGGLELKSIEDFNRFCVFHHAVDKMTRYGKQFRQGGHADSLDDLSVYAQILQELDQDARV